ncbi:MFS transporter [Tsukamurella strandjordii]|uniref:Putative proline/betaine transporter n=1 Tax=Tsukamurella strandjordii TaxID=147577 RepID=A0AA90S8F8_9ACTN|nr:MFS transporter [Tsukamurella strandjordii]MDP0398810.1 MFS transporter [Tsukamurella strandjordii]
MSMPDNSTTSGSSPLSTVGLQETEQERKKTLHKAIAASAMGNFTEWFDYGVYAATTAYLTQAFFPGTLGTLGALLGFAVSFALRPLGGFVWGPLGDRLGRKVVLATTILLMATSTALIGVLPTYAQVGVLAPILLIGLRVVQGFSTGGEYGGAATFMAEYSPDDKRGKYGSFLEFGTMCGFAGGTAFVLMMQQFLTSEEMYSWGWRIPFFVAIPLGFVGWYLRNQLDDTPVFEEMADEQEAQGSAWDRFTSLLRDYKRPIMIMFGMVVALNVANYTLLAYMPTYLQNTIGLTESDTSVLMLIGQLAMALCIPFFGALSDRTGRKPMWWISLIGLLVMAVPMFWLMGQGFWWAVLGFVVLGLLYIPQLSTITATFPAMFPTQVRYAGFAISYNVATAMFGGTAPLVNDAVVEGTGWNLFPAVYMMGACAIGLIALPFLQETKGCSIRGTEVPGPDTNATRLAQIEEAKAAA